MNLGGYYNVTSGIYTVPIDGVYEFILHVLCIDDADCGVYIEVDNVRVSRILLLNIFTTCFTLTNQQSFSHERF